MKTLFLALLALALPALAFANGSSVRGGGKGVVCRDPQGNLLSAVLLDLWEAEKFYDRTLAPSQDPVANQAENAIERLEYINDFLPSMTNVPNLKPEDKVTVGVWRLAQLFLAASSPEIKRFHGVALTPTEDSFEVIQPQQPGCAIEQIVAYQDRVGQGPEILVNQDLYEKLSPTGQAALIVHEALYAYLRIFEDKNSMRTRRVVGYVFAGLTFPDLNQQLPAQYTACYFEKAGGDRTRKPALFFYPGAAADSLQAIRNNDLRPLPILGYFPASVDVGIVQSLDEATEKHVRANLFTEQLCDTPYMHTPGNVIAGYLTMPGTGPADYDHANSVSFFCKADGTRELKLIQADITEPNGTSKTHDLFCEQVQR